MKRCNTIIGRVGGVLRRLMSSNAKDVLSDGEAEDSDYYSCDEEISDGEDDIHLSGESIAGTKRFRRAEGTCKRVKKKVCGDLNVANFKGIEMYDMKSNAKSTIKVVLNAEGKQKVSTDIDLNVHFDSREANVRSNHRHWNLQAGIREIMANAHDASFDKAAETMFHDGQVPNLETIHGDVGVSGCVSWLARLLKNL